MSSDLGKEIAGLRRDIKQLIKLLKGRDTTKAMTISEFCDSVGESEAQYRKDPHKPDVFYIGEPDAGRKTPRISPESRRRWLEERERIARAYAANKEAAE